ncbi:MAG TPA: insulinase family protein [Bacteroidales bacterium]|nr:insulinase family protein [Bacteroidales bacterium]
MIRLINLLWLLPLFTLIRPAIGQEKMPIDPNIKMGKLDNGLVYYIRKNAKPEKRVELRLAVNAGSILETDDQQGLAHFCEHMCFNGTKNFPHAELVNTIERMGIKFGADLNAYTSFDETVYMLKVPTDQTDLIDKGFQILEDWAHQVTLDGKEIDKERGVILEEWRLGLGADDRMRKKSFPVIFKDSKYAERIPIGKPEILKTFKHETLRQFYKDWYRPNLQAVIVVGDIDVDQMEQKIKQHFSGIQNPVNERKREIFDLPDNKEPLVSIETDEEATSNTVMFFYKHPKKYIETIEDFKFQLMQDLFTGMINNRLEEIGQKPDCPYIYAGTQYGEFLARTKDSYLGYAVSKENQIEKSLETVMTENQRVKQFGFTVTEFERQKTELLKRYEKQAKEFDKMESGNLAMEYVYHFLAKNPIPGAVKEFEFAKQFLPEIKLEEVNALSKQWITDNNLVVMITAPKKDGIKVPTKDDVLKIIDKVKSLQLTAYEDKQTDAPLLAKIPEGSKVVNRKENKDLGTVEYTFENGAQVILKQTDFKNNEIQFSGYTLGGTSLAKTEDILNAMYASSIIEECGLGQFSKSDLKKKLAGKDIDITPYIQDLKQGFNGKVAPADLETMLQLLYMYFTDIRKDDEAFKAFMSKLKSQFMFISSNPQFAFFDKFTKIITQNDPRTILIPTEEQLQTVTLEKSIQFFKERFNNARDFKFFFVGNINENEALPLIQKYIGGLPSQAKSEMWKDVSPKFPSGIVQETVYKGKDEKGFVGMAWNTNYEWSSENNIKTNILIKILDIMLRENVREKESGTYGIQARLDYDKYPKEEISVTIIFGCDPKNQDKLSKVVIKQMQELQKKGPSEENLKKIKEQLIRERETDLKKNNWWIRKLDNMYYYNDLTGSLNEYNNIINKVTAKDIQELANKYFVMNNYVKVYLKPEKK